MATGVMLEKMPHGTALEVRPLPATDPPDGVVRRRSRVVLAGESPPLVRRESNSTLPSISPKLARRKSRRSLGPVPLSNILETQNSTLRKDWIVSSPRKIQFERTMMRVESNLSVSLQSFFDEVAFIPTKQIDCVRSKANSFLEYLMPRLIKLANKHGMKVTGHYLAGSTFDQTQVVSKYEVDIFLLLERGKTQLDDLEGGYRVLPIRKYRVKPGQPPDQHRYGRSESGLFLSSLKTASLFHELVERALKLNLSTSLEPFLSQADTSQIAVRWKKYTFHLKPAIYMPKEECYLLTQPYSNDTRPSHELAWRVSYIRKERNILALMDKADRGARTKAFLILKALVRVEPTLEGLTSYHIKTVLLHSFDSTVDKIPRWQRDPVEMAFMELLRQLHDFLVGRSLPHFFVGSLDLFNNLDQRRLASLESRVGYIVANENELIRILKKRT